MNDENTKSTKDWEELAQKSEQEVADEAAKAQAAEEHAASDELPLELLEHPSYKAMQDKLTEAEQKIDQLMRNLSEMQTARSRIDREMSIVRKYAAKPFIQSQLPLLDSLEQALQTPISDDSAAQGLREGLELTLKMALDIFEKFSVKQIKPLGEIFDPNLHEAMSMQADPEAKPGQILAVFQAGYLLHERVIRPARVVVAKNENKNLDENA